MRCWRRWKVRTSWRRALSWRLVWRSTIQFSGRRLSGKICAQWLCAYPRRITDRSGRTSGARRRTASRRGRRPADPLDPPTRHFLELDRPPRPGTRCGDSSKTISSARACVRDDCSRTRFFLVWPLRNAAADGPKWRPTWNGWATI